MERKKSEQFRKERRNKSEQFRKSRNNFFHRAYEICVKSEAKILVLIERKGKYYRLLTSESLLHLSEAEIAASLAMSRTADDFNKDVPALVTRVITMPPTPPLYVNSRERREEEPRLAIGGITVPPTAPLYNNSREGRGKEPALVTGGITMPPTPLLHLDSGRETRESSGNPDLPSFATLLEQIRSLGRRK